MDDAASFPPDTPRRAPPFAKGNNANPAGRPIRPLRPYAIGLIERLAARGVPEFDISLSCGMWPDAFRSRKRSDARIVEAIERGRSRARARRTTGKEDVSPRMEV